jgi:hypothetical protein
LDANSEEFIPQLRRIEPARHVTMKFNPTTFDVTKQDRTFQRLVQYRKSGFYCALSQYVPKCPKK